MKVDIAQHPDLMKYIQLGLKKTIGIALVSSAQRIVQLINVEIIPSFDHPPVDRGTYRAGWRVEAKPNVVHIVNTVKHSPFIEFGVRASNVKPGRAMVGALTQWVRRKGIGGGVSKTGKPTKPSLDQAASTAWAIAKSMAGYQAKIGWVPGTGIFKGNTAPGGFRVLERAMTKFTTFFEEEFKSALKKVK